MVINFLSLSSHVKAPWMNLSKLQHNRTFFFLSFMFSIPTHLYLNLMKSKRQSIYSFNLSSDLATSSVYMCIYICVCIYNNHI
ncbi:hypothetical protein LguiB_031029 [Lonicera macranthoides]